jgi:hypothetical protein
MDFSLRNDFFGAALAAPGHARAGAAPPKLF